MNKNELASQQTIKLLVNIAREHFSRFGYADTSLESVASEAGLTRGALYHHFKNKKHLFIAVVTEVQLEIAHSIATQSQLVNDLWEQLIVGCIAFIQTAITEKNKRILLIDAPNVIEWREWKTIDNKNSSNLLLEHLQSLSKKGFLVEIEVSLISSMISGALDELALNIAESNLMLDVEKLYEIISTLVKGFKK